MAFCSGDELIKVLRLVIANITVCWVFHGEHAIIWESPMSARRFADKRTKATR
jgi:hypothetical protein